MGRITSTTPFIFDGSRKLLRRIGKPSPPAKHRKALDGWCYGTKSITKHQRAWAMKLCCAHGSVKRPGSPLSGLPKCSGVATDNCYQRPGRSGVRSMRKPGGPSASLLKCVSNFRFELFERKTCPLISGIIPHPPPPFAREKRTQWLASFAAVGRGTLSV